MRALRIIIAVLLIMGVAAGCGYRLAGGGYVNEDVARVRVDVFENASAEPGIGVSFTNELIREILAKTDTRVENHAGRRIVGTVKSITFSTLSRSSATDIAEREVVAVVDVRLLDAAGQILWSVKDFSARESYTVSQDTVVEEAGKRQAVETIAQRVAERLVSRMTSGF